MSVKIRTQGHREYLHIRRRTSEGCEQQYIAVTGLSPKELALAKHTANKADKLMEAAQYDTGLMGVFFHLGSKPKRIRIAKPAKRAGWAMVIQYNNQDSWIKSASLDKYGFDAAFDMLFKLMVKYEGFKLKSPNIQLIKSVVKQQIKADYNKLLKIY